MTMAECADEPNLNAPHPWRSLLVPLTFAGGCFAAVGGLIDGARENADLSSFDPRITEAVVERRSPGLTRLVHVVTDFGSVPVLVLLAVVVASALSWHWRSRQPLVTMAVALGGSAVLTYGLKVLIARQRPPTSDMAGAVDLDFSFPSGHTLNSAVFLAVICWLLREQFTRTWRRAGLCVAVLIALAVGMSRVYLGYHWMTDVLAGWLIAAGWLALLLAARRAGRNT